MGITFTSTGDWKKTEKFLKAMGDGDPLKGLDAIAKRGVLALQSATPVDSGVAASSWGYTVQRDRGGVTIAWTNTDTINNIPIVVLLQYGHGTGTGGYVRGRDFINPAIKPIFDEISEQVWKAVKSA